MTDSDRDEHEHERGHGPADAAGPIHHERWFCPECDGTFDDSTMFVGHIALHSLEAVIDYQQHRGECWECPHCPRIFDQRDAYDQHAATCTPSEVTADD